MGTDITLTAADGHTLSAYRTGPEAATRGLVVVQEIFGVNHHIRNVCDRLAALGYAVVAPALFDRTQRGVQLGYTADDVAVGRELRGRIADTGPVLDIEAAADALPGATLGVIGFCWGGTVAWWAATRSKRFAATCGWYGGGIAGTATEAPVCPVQLHFGEKDSGIPLTDVEIIRTAQPGLEIFIYDGAQHGFGCDERASFSPPDAALAWSRSEAFLAANLGA